MAWLIVSIQPCLNGFHDGGAVVALHHATTLNQFLPKAAVKVVGDDDVPADHVVRQPSKPHIHTPESPISRVDIHTPMGLEQALWPDQRTRAAHHARQPGAVQFHDKNRAIVQSFSTKGRAYTVAHAGNTWLCDCDFYTLTGLPCGHSAAARIAQTQQVTNLLRAAPAPSASKWSAYDTAQANEVHIFDALLSDLCASIQEPTYKGNGRPPLPLRTQAFCAIQKVYSQLSGRRAKALYDKAAQRGELEDAPSYMAASRFLNREDATSILTALIRASAAPLVGIEHDFAADSTGFRTTTFGPYCDDKHGGKRKHQFLKAHAICGVRSNIVTDCIVTASYGPGSADSPNLPALVQGTAQHFDVDEVSADKAYSGKANLYHIHRAGAAALIPFREGKSAPAPLRSGGSSNANAPGCPGSAKLWRRAFHYFQAHREEFDARYHKRSNIESTFSAIKRKFGDSLKSKNEVAQQNEVLAKVLAYNITVLIKTAYTLGVDLGFLKQNPAPEEV